MKTPSAKIQAPGKRKKARILQISNDIAEDMNYGNHSKAEYREVILYWMNRHSDICNEVANLKTEKLFECLKQLDRGLQRKGAKAQRRKPRNEDYFWQDMMFGYGHLQK